MTANYSTATTLPVAIDISKHRHEVLIGVPGKTRCRRLTIMNTLEGFQHLSAAIASYDLPVRIGFEAPGNYHRTLALHLGQAGFELKLASSVALARTREALHDSWDSGPASSPTRSMCNSGSLRMATRSSGWLVTFLSRMIVPRSSMMQTGVSLTETSRPA